MDFLEYVDLKGYHRTLVEEVIKNKKKYTYKFKSKGKWQIAPKWELKILQKILKDYLSEYYSSKNISNNATAYIKGKNLSYNVTRHQGNSFFFTTDFENFFPSIKLNDVKSNLKEILNLESPESFSVIVDVAFFEDNLQYGFPTSPIISNFILNEFDNELYKELKTSIKENIQYTRYSDDITISTKYKINKQELLLKINNLIKSKYTFLKLNNKKTRFFEKYAHRAYITGLIPLNNRNTIGKNKFNQLKLNTYLILNGKLISNENLFKNVNQLASYISYIYLVDKHNYIRLKNSFIEKYSTLDIFKELFRK